MIENVHAAQRVHLSDAPERPARPFIAIPPSPALEACVVIPARDEAESIEQTLAALAVQRGVEGQPLDPSSVEVILLANNCRDATASVARRWAKRNGRITLHVVDVEFPPDLANVGYARRLAMDEACRRLFAVGRPRGVIATTDADTIVSPTWLAATFQEVACGAEAVGGRILVTATERRAMAPAARSRFLRNVGYGSLANEVAARIDPRPGDPWPCHEQFSGASLAVTARAYRAVGGLPPLPSGEDTALADALLRADIEIRHSLAVRVHTSGRLDGRTPAGLAAALAIWSNLTLDGQFQLVPSAATVVERSVARRALRDLWQQAQVTRDACAAEVARLADFATVPEAWLHHALLDAARFGVLLPEFEARSRWRRTPDMVDVRHAITDLRDWLSTYRRPSVRPPTFARRLDGLPFLAPARPRSRRVARPLPVPPSPVLPTLEHVQTVGPLSASLASPPHVA